jgi:tRNA 2-thiouridine synthesizing protein A
MEQARQKIDLRGLTCPEPVIRTKKLFDDTQTEAVEAIVDDEVCVNNLQRLARSLKASFAVIDNDGYFTVKLERGESSKASQELHEHSFPAGVGTSVGERNVGTVLLIGKDTFGSGDEDFSRTLMNLFLQTSFESGMRPRAILMVNTGVRLLAGSSQALKVLDDFRAAGTDVFACGLCVDYYKLKDEIRSEQITNMFAICEYIFAADKVIQL